MRRLPSPSTAPPPTPTQRRRSTPPPHRCRSFPDRCTASPWPPHPQTAPQHLRGGSAHRADAPFKWVSLTLEPSTNLQIGDHSPEWRRFTKRVLLDRLHSHANSRVTHSVPSTTTTATNACVYWCCCCVATRVCTVKRCPSGAHNTVLRWGQINLNTNS